MKVVKKRSIILVFVLIFLGLFLNLTQKANAKWSNHIVISEVQITGGTGKTNSDFVELYNPTNLTIDISGWKLRKRIQNGGESSIRVFPQGKTISPYGYFLWANSNNDFHLTINADESSTAILTDDNSIALFDNNGNLVDALSWGSDHSNPYIETAAYPDNPGPNQSLERKPGGEQGNGEDANNNSQDFLKQDFSEPQNSQSPANPFVQELICGNGICEQNEDSVICPNDCQQQEQQQGQEGQNEQNGQNGQEKQQGQEGRQQQQEITIQSFPSNIIINEFLPNPQGNDSEKEFIELKNLNNFEVDLEGWKLEDGSGSKFTISSKNLSSVKIPAKGFLVLERKITNIALNNSGSETINFYQPNNTLIDFVKYDEEVRENFAYIKDEKGNWVLTIQPTPGQENIRKEPNQQPKAIIIVKANALIDEEIIFDASDSYDPDGDRLIYLWDFGDETKGSEALAKHIFKKAGKYKVELEIKDSFGAKDVVKLDIEILENQKNLFNENELKKDELAIKKNVDYTQKKKTSETLFKEISLSDIRNQELGDMVKVQGIVSVEPGILGSQIFYLSGSGIQVYFFKKDFPELRIGDKIEITGELSEYKGETRLKIFSRQDIKFLENKALPTTKEVKINEINETLEGSLAVVEGQMIESGANYFYLSDGNGSGMSSLKNSATGKIKIYLKKTAGIKEPKLQDGEWLRITGIVSQNEREYRILPRYQSDIEIIKKEKTNSRQTTAFLADNFLKTSPETNQLWKILLVLFGIALSTIYLVLFILKKKN